MSTTKKKPKGTRAPKGGLRIGGKTYREGQFMPRKYARVLEQGQPHIDPAQNLDDAPPNFGRPVLPHILTFGGLISTFSQVYRNPDTAIRDSIENARIMRQDCSIMECLEARQRATALLNWHLEPEDKDSQEQKDLCARLTEILARTPRFTEYRRNLLEAIWYGRYAVQNLYGFELVNGQRRTIIKNWRPVNGDKLCFRFDDGSGKFQDEQVGIRVGTNWSFRDKLAGDRLVEYTDQGPAYFLEDWERSRLAIHKHMIEDGAYEDPVTAGRIHGVGIRDRIYWCWFQKQETLAHLMEIIERTGTGFTIYYYPDGNPRAKAEMQEVAEKQTRTNVILMPRAPDDGMNLYDIQRIEPSTQGVEVLRTIISEFFGHQIKRYILGQTLSTEASGTGLGSGLSDLHESMFLQIISYDAVNLEETISREIVRPLLEFNFPRQRHVNLTFRIDTESNDSDEKLKAYQAAWNMGAKIRSSDVMDIIGAAMPQEGEEYLFNPQILQQIRLFQHEMGGDAGGPAGDLAAQFGPLAEMFSGQQEPQQDEPPPDQDTGPVQYAKMATTAQPTQQQHHVGETKVVGGVTYRLNEQHRWELASEDPQGGDRFKQPTASPMDHESRDKAAKAALKSVDPTVGGIIRALHESPEYKSGGAVTTMDVAPAQAKRAYDMLRQQMGQDAAGGSVVDFGGGKIGFASAAGSFVIEPNGGRFQVHYTNQTELVGGDSGPQDTEAIGGDDTQEVEPPPIAPLQDPGEPPTAPPEPEDDDDEEIDIEIEPEDVDPTKARQKAEKARMALDAAVEQWQADVDQGVDPKTLSRHRSNVSSLRAIWRELETAANHAEKKAAKPKAAPKAKAKPAEKPDAAAEPSLLDGVSDLDPANREPDTSPPPDVDWSGANTWKNTVQRKSLDWDMPPHEFEKLADELYKEFTDRISEVEAAKAHARKLTNLKASDISRLENKGFDSGSQHDRIKQLDTIGRELATQYPALGWGEGYGSGDDTDYGSKLWDLIREGKTPVPSKNSPEFIEHVEDFLRSQYASYNPSSAQVDPELEAVPFHKQSGLLYRYRKWCQR